MALPKICLTWVHFNIGELIWLRDPRRDKQAHGGQPCHPRSSRNKWLFGRQISGTVYTYFPQWNIYVYSAA